MATLQKIRSNRITQIAIGLGMLGFIATGAVEILSKGQQAPTVVAEVNGEELNINDFNAMVDEYKTVLQAMGQLPAGEQVSNEVMQQLRDQVWQQYIQQQMLQTECDKLGLAVTDAEIQSVLKAGTHPLLAQTPFCTQQGQFDLAALQQFLKQREEMMGNAQIAPEQRAALDSYYVMWCFIEKQLRNTILMEKYQNILSGLLITNPVSAKAHFDGRTNETDILVAALPYTSIEDKAVTTTVADIQKLYDAYKEAIYQPVETRDIKYVDVVIRASADDEKKLSEEMAGYAEQLKAEDADAAAIVHQSQSLVAYSPVPVRAAALPRDIAAQLDSMAVGAQIDPYYNAADNTQNIIRLLGKVSRPDSVEVRQLFAINADAAKARQSADSIITALKGGAEFDSIAKFYNQPGTKQWITSQMYEGQQMDDNTKKMIETATTAAVGSYSTIEVDGAVLILNVTDQRNVVNKYDVAVIKRSVDFSNETAQKYFNDLSSFVAANKTIADMEKNQGVYAVLSRTDLETATYGLPNIEDSREVVRWAYNEDTKVGDFSDLIYCGKTRDHIVVACLTAIHEPGYRDIKDEQLNRVLTDQAIRDKKAEKLMEQLKGAKSMADVAKMPGCVQDTVQHITFNASAYLAKMGGVNEPAISGAASVAKQGAFVTAVRGNAGVYAFQVLSKTANKEEKYDEKAEMQSMQQENMRLLSMMFQAGYQQSPGVFYKAFRNCGFKDHRNIFF